MSEPCPVPRRGAPDGDAAGHGALARRCNPVGRTRSPCRLISAIYLPDGNQSADPPRTRPGIRHSIYFGHAAHAPS